MLRLTGTLLLGLVLSACSPAPLANDGGAGDVGPCVEDAECDDGAFCNGVERCQPGSSAADGRGCVAAIAPACVVAGQVCDERLDRCETDCGVGADLDDDGVTAVECGGSDCDDGDARRSPTALEVCDADDIDEDCDPTTTGARDADGDGENDALCCNGATCGTDCDDRHAEVRPGATETCNGRDDDCDEGVDEGVTVSGFADDDRDLHGDPARARAACPGTPGFASVGDDCDDGNVARHGGQPELCDAVDNDCDETVDESPVSVRWYADLDGDGFGSAASGVVVSCAPVADHVLLGTDCDDARRGVSPAAPEQCNGLDDDCSGAADYVIVAGGTEDDDVDGFADVACGPSGMDCDDGDAAVGPGASEICDGLDNDCDGAADVATVDVGWFVDRDGDGFGDPVTSAVSSCAPIPGRVTRGGDCDDSSAEIRPGVADPCGGGDDDCDGRTDEDGVRFGLPRWTADRDGDGAPAPDGDVVEACGAPTGYAGGTVDCDDRDASRAPGLPERCNGRDDDCDTTLDEAPASLSCDAAHASGASCVAGVCTLSGCSAGFADCDGLASSGCEVDVRVDRENCAGCGMACSPGDECASSTCTSPLFVDVATAAGTTCGVLDNGRVLCWGDGTGNRLGAGSTLASTPTPIEVADLRDAASVVVGGSFACALSRSGAVWCWGANGAAQLTWPTSTFASSPVPILARALPAAVEIVLRDAGACARLESGAVACWGFNLDGQVGDGTVSSAPVVAPVMVSGLTDAIDLGTTSATTCAVRATGTVVCWGAAGPVGQLGLPSGRAPTPVEVTGVTGALEVDGVAGGATMCARLSSGRMSCWGANTSGQIGDGSTSDRPLAVLVPGLTNVARLAVGVAHVCVQRGDGVVLCSGANAAGELGMLAAGSSFRALPGLDTPGAGAAVVELEAGPSITCVRFGDGRVACAGLNDRGQLGDGGTASRPTLVTVSH